MIDAPRGCSRSGRQLAFALAALGSAACTSFAPIAGDPAAGGATAPTAAAIVPLGNPGFESDQPAGSTRFDGWVTTQHAGDRSYLYTLDATTRHGGRYSLRVDNVGSEPYGAVMQVVDARSLAGHRVRFSAWLATREAGGDGASLLVVAEGTRILAHDQMAGAEVKGTRDWARYAITLALPPATTQLRLGAVLQGKGTAWVDDAVLEIVD